MKLPDLHFFPVWLGQVGALLVLWLWLVSQTAGSVGETSPRKHLAIAAHRCSLPQPSLWAHSLSLKHHPGRSLRRASAGTTHTERGARPKGIPVCSHEIRELLLCCVVLQHPTADAEPENQYVLGGRQNKHFMLLGN